MLRLLLALLVLFIRTDQDQTRFSFTEKSELEWADFKALPDEQNAFAASANTGLSQTYLMSQSGAWVKDSVKVTAYFYPKLSWYKPEFASSMLLKHERGHFAISEIHARKLRGLIHNFRFSARVRQQLDSLYHVVEKERLKMQLLYDMETVHSRNKTGEKRWQEKIQSELKFLDLWAAEK